MTCAIFLINLINPACHRQALNYNSMNPHIKQMLDYKQRALKKTTNPVAIRAIEFEIFKLSKINEDIETLEAEKKELAEYARNLEEAKAIAEMVGMIHGIKPEVISDYYREGLIATLNTLRNLTEENQIIIPHGLKKYFKK